MKTIFSLILALLIFSFTSEKTERKDSINILFVGNSLTSVGDMPDILQKMFDNANLNFKVSQSTFNGLSLQAHLETMVDSVIDGTTYTRDKKSGDTTSTEKALNAKKWDYIVLQEGTVRFLIPEVKILHVIPAINEIKKRIKCKPTIILFKTWPSLDTFPKQFCYPSRVVDKSITKAMCCSFKIKSIDEEINLINSGYDTVAAATGLKTLPITNCFAEVLKKNPNINLYEDESHPSKLGAYLNACVYFKYFTKQKASTIKYNSDINEGVTNIIKSVVDKVSP